MNAANSKLGFLLIGHGSRRKEANQSLANTVETLKQRLNIENIEVAFFSLAKPDIPAAIKTMFQNGCRKILAQPFFLFNGNHTTVDLPNLLKDVASEYNGLEIKLLDTLGHDKGILSLIEERFIDAISPYEILSQPIDNEIEKASMSFIEKRLACYKIDPEHRDVIKRVIHATTDFEYVHSLKFYPTSVKIATKILTHGCRIITDVKMVAAGIRKRDGDEIICSIGDKDVEDLARNGSMTRAAAAMEKLIPVMDGAIVVIGNSPTALAKVIDIVETKRALPWLIIGVPVGFVDAAKVKSNLTRLNIPYITNSGHKGGSSVAVSIINALILQT